MKNVARLVDQIRPSRYILSLDVDMTHFHVAGRERIEFELIHASSVLTFHAVGLDVLSGAKVGAQPTKRISYDEDAQTVSFHFDSELPAGTLVLELEFMTTITESLHGLYRSSYQHDGQQKWLMTTQFEPAHARQAMVCIDEPAAKAVCEYEMTVPAQLKALSNMDPIAITQLADGRKRVEFESTPKMSTYLGYLGVGDFECIEGRTKRGTIVRVWATPGKKDQLGFALETAVRGLEFYEDYFDIAYPLSKLDMIVIPDFAAGAMENWGAITYRDTAAMLDPKQTSLAQKQRVATVVLHELAHQWFGNLVTMAWWNDLWLNEGFASWIEVLAQDALFPEWNVWQMFINSDYSRALDDDSLANTHAIEVEVQDPRALDEIFDAISYSKGSSIINFLHQWLGADKFRDGLRLYLKRHQYGNTITADLWAALGESSGQPVSEVMAAWTSQPGFPLVRPSKTMMSQTRFYASPREAAAAKDAPTWPIPWSEVVPAGTEPRQLLMRGRSVALPATTASWFKPNPGQTGFYRTLYSPSMLTALQAPLADGTLNGTDRYGVVSDIFATTQAGLTSSSVALKLLATLRRETDYVVWTGLSGGLGSVLHLVDDGDVRRRFERFGAWFTKPALDRLGWTATKDESTFDTLMRPMVIQQAIRFDDEAATAEANARFAHYLKDGSIDPNLRAAIYYAIARHGGETEFDTFLELYRKEAVPQVKLQLLASLARFRKPKLISRALELGLSKDVRSQDTIYTVAYSLMNRDGRDLAWQFVQDNWPEFLKRYGSGGHMLENFPSYVGMAFTSHAKADEVKAFFAARPHPAITRPVAQAVESINLSADWYERDHQAIEQFLTDWEAGQKA